MSGVLLDTDVLIDHIRGRHVAQIDGSMASVVTRTELFAGNEREEPAVTALLGRITELEVTVDIARRAGRIRRTTGLDIADALIAATALEHDLALMTRNLRHFERVAGLIVHAPRNGPDSKGDPEQTPSEPSDLPGPQSAGPLG
jgi:predicted nucleic acid-binding protein